MCSGSRCSAANGSGVLDTVHILFLLRHRLDLLPQNLVHDPPAQTAMTDHRPFANLSGASDAQSPGSPIEWSTIQRILTHIEYQQHYQIIRLAVENLKELLEPNWTRFDASLRTIVSDILGETLDKARKVNNDEGLRKRKRIKELIVRVLCRPPPEPFGKS